MSRTRISIQISEELAEVLRTGALGERRSLSSYIENVLLGLGDAPRDYPVLYDERTEVLPPDPKPVPPPEGVVYDPDTRKKVVVGEPTEAQAAFRRQMLAKGK